MAIGECQVTDFEPNVDAAPYIHNFSKCFAGAVGVYHVCDPELQQQMVVRLCKAHYNWQQTTRCVIVELTICPRCDGYGHDPCEHCGFLETQTVATRNSMQLEHAPYKKFTLEDEGFFKNAREFVDKREIRELADSIEVDGLKVPLGVIKRGEKLLIVSGSRRYRAIGLLITEKRSNGIGQKVPFVVSTGKHTAVTARVEGLIDNIQRKDLTSYEIAAQLHELRTAGLAQAAIAEQIHKSQSYVSRLLKCFAACAPAVHKAWKQKRLPDDDVQTLSKLPPPEQERRLVKLMEHRDAAATAKPGQVRSAKAAARQAAKGTTKTKEKAPPKAVRPDGGNLKSFANMTAKAPKSNKYVRGMHDAFRYMLGELGPGEFDDAFTKWAASQGTTDKAAAQKKLPASGKAASKKKTARK